MVSKAYLGASASFDSLPGSVASLGFRGPLTLGVFGDMRTDFRRFIEQTGAQAFIADLRQALILLDSAAMAPKLPPVAPLVPGALVVVPSSVPAFKAHAMNMAKLGILRGVFTESEPAYAWAQEKAPLAPRHRRIQSSAK